MTTNGFLCRCTRTRHTAALALLLILTALCVAQEAQQNSSVDANAASQAAATAPAESDQMAPAPEAPAQSVAVPAEAVTAVTQSNAEPNQSQTQADVLTPLEQRMRKTVSVEFRETPIADVVRQLGAQADVDIIMSPKVIGNVTATLTDVPLDEALNNILAVQGAAYVAGKNMIRVVPLNELMVEQAKMVTRVYRIMYADVKDVAAALEKYISKSGQISYAVGTSNIIVTDSEDKIKSIDTFIKEIDRVTPQVMVDAKVYDISSDDSIDLGIQWTAGTNTNFGDPGGLGSLDKSGEINPFEQATVDSATTFTKVTNPASIRFGWLNGSTNIDAIVSAQQKGVSAKLLANPRVLVLDNEKANIRIIQEVPYQELSQTSGGGNIGTTQFKDVGVELTVVPHVTDNGLIRVRLKPTFSTKGEVLRVQVPGTLQVNEVPAIDKREADSVALIKDGETIVLGGLRKRTINREVDKVPLLGDIPIIGLLFRFQGEQAVNSELVVFVTTHIQNATPVMSERDNTLLEQTNTTIPRTDQKMLLDKLKRD